MNILDYIRKLFKTNKKYPKLITQDLHKTTGESDQLEIALYYEQEPITDKKITIEINGVTYQRTTNNEGIAKLNINLPVGTYDCHVSFDDPDYTYVKTFVKVVVNPIVTTNDLSMTEKDGSKFTAVLSDANGNKVNNKKVIFNVNGIDYERTTNNNGEASLPINLNTGNYKILTKTFDITKENTIHIAEKPPEPQPTPTPTPTPTPQKSRSEKILDEFEKYFGTVKYIDDALAKVQNKGYAFYFSDGYNMYETIKRIANGQGANCFDSAEVFYHLAKGMNTKYGRNYEVWYLDVWCPVSGYDHIRLRLRSNGGSYFYRDPACVLDGGAVTSNWCGTSNNILEVNPSWIYDGD